MPFSRRTNFMRALNLFLRLPVSLKTRRTASMVGSNSSSGRNSVRTADSVGKLRNPPPTRTLKPRRARPAPGGIPAANFRQAPKLRRLHSSRRDFHAQHLEARLPLAVRTVLQAERAKLFFGNFAAAELLRTLFKARDLRFYGFAAVPFLDLSCCSASHKPWPANPFLASLSEMCI